MQYNYFCTLYTVQSLGRRADEINKNYLFFVTANASLYRCAKLNNIALSIPWTWISIRERHMPLSLLTENCVWNSHWERGYDGRVVKIDHVVRWKNVSISLTWPLQVCSRAYRWNDLSSHFCWQILYIQHGNKYLQRKSFKKSHKS